MERQKTIESPLPTGFYEATLKSIYVETQPIHEKMQGTVGTGFFVWKWGKDEKPFFTLSPQNMYSLEPIFLLKLLNSLAVVRSH